MKKLRKELNNETNTRIIDYTALVQDGLMTVDDVPQDIKKEVTKWVRYFQGIKEDDSMVKADESDLHSIEGGLIEYDSNN